MEQTMQAVGFRRYGPAEALELLDVPRPTLAPDTLLIRIAAAGINPADWRIRSGQFRFFAPVKFPFVPGSDVAGVVEQIGGAVTGFHVGQAVFAMLPSLSGGGYAQYVAVPARNAAPMPANLPFEEAAAAPLAALTALQALRDQAGLKPGAHLLINGASGGVGSFAVQIAKVMGARVTAACSGRNTDLVRDLGADAVVDYTQTDLLAGSARYDGVFDAANVHSVWRWRRVVNPGGAVVSVNPLYDMVPLKWLVRLGGSRRLRSLLVQPSGADLAMIGGWIAAGKLRPLVDRPYPLAHAQEAQRYSESGRVRGKLVLIVDDKLCAARAEAAPRERLEPAHA